MIGKELMRLGKEGGRQIGKIGKGGDTGRRETDGERGETDGEGKGDSCGRWGR